MEAVDTLTAVAEADSAKLGGSLAEARLGIECSAKLVGLGAAVAEGTNALAERVALAVDGLRRLLSSYVSTEGTACASERPAPSAKRRPHLKVVGSSAFPDGE